MKKFVQWDDVMAEQKSLENTFNSIQNKQARAAYDIYNDLLLLSLPTKRHCNLIECSWGYF